MSDLNPGAWFRFDESDPESGKICVRTINNEKLAEIRNKTIKTKVEYRGDNRHEYHEIDHTARDNIIWDYCIVDWRGLVDDNDKPIECNFENKVKLMNGHIGFSLFVDNCLNRLNQQNEIYAEYREKNL
jgi:hypothetical protein